jgi:hypothetical protein
MTAETRMREPYIGEELISIHIEAYEIHFIFTDTVLQVRTSFSVACDSEIFAEFNPSERKGDLVVLWAMIGRRAKNTSWENEVTIALDSDYKIVIPPLKNHIRGSIVSRHKIEDKIFWQDF